MRPLDKMREILEVYLQRSQDIIECEDDYDDDQFLKSLRRREAAFRNLAAMEYLAIKVDGFDWAKDPILAKKLKKSYDCNLAIEVMLSKRMRRSHEELAKVIQGRQKLKKFKSGESDLSERITRSV